MAQETISSYVKAIFDFDAVESGDLAVREGDVIRVVETLDDGVWIRGELNQKIGVLPANHTEPCTQPTTPQLLKAKIAFDGDRDGDLSFARGETIEFVERVDAEWTRGRTRDREGIFPTSFVEWAPMEQEQQKKTKSPTPPPVKPKPRKKLRPRSMANALDAPQDPKESDAIRRKSVGNFIDSDTPPPVKPKPALKPKPKPKPKVIEEDLTSDEKTIPIIKRELVVETKPVPVARKRFISQGCGQDVKSSPRPRITSIPTFSPSPSPPLIAPKPVKRNIDGGGVAVRPKPRPKPRPRPLTQIILDDDDKEDDKREDNVLRKRRQSLGDDSLLTSGDDSKVRKLGYS